MPADAPLLCSPPQEELLFFKRKETLEFFEREKNLHNTSEVDKSARLDSFCVPSFVSSSGA